MADIISQIGCISFYCWLFDWIYKTTKKNIMFVVCKML